MQTLCLLSGRQVLETSGAVVLNYTCLVQPEENRFTIGVINSSSHTQTDKWGKHAARLTPVSDRSHVSVRFLHCTRRSHFNNGLEVRTAHGDQSRILGNFVHLTELLPDLSLNMAAASLKCVCVRSDQTRLQVGWPPFLKYLLSWTLAAYASPQIIESIPMARSPPCFSCRADRRVPARTNHKSTNG